MYKLIFVEDDKQKREQIIECIDFNACGFELSGEAGDGFTALEIAESCRPDLVITDIKMPYMDGLELCKKLIDLPAPTPKIVIMSGYSEFEYAHKALSLHVSEYLLKPVDLEQFTKVLTAVKHTLDEEISIKENITFLKDHYIRSLPMLKEKFIQTLLTRQIPTEEIHKKIELYQLNLFGNSYIVSLLQITQLIDSNTDSFNSNNNELSIYAVYNVAQETLEKYSFASCYIINDNIVTIFVFQHETPLYIINRCHHICEEIIYTADKFLSIPVSLGIGNIVDSISDLKASYESALSALNYRIIYGNKKAIYIGDVERPVKGEPVYNENKEFLLIRILKTGNIEELHTFFDKLFRLLDESSHEIIQLTVIMLLSSLLKAAYSCNIKIKHITNRNDLLKELFSISGIANLKNWFMQLSEKTMHQIQSERQHSSDVLINKSVKYVHDNYHDSHLTISKVCEHLFVSQSYFCSIFKKHIKDTFTNYLTRVRIKKAKELLLTSDEKIYSIAEKVGYSDSNYFSYCFKKNIGLSPSDYRANHIKND